mmetsp:Transcript_57801/g.161306  ORF Transcript_57801/g.161306 Transcript_57801/m.161306 type:complete len:230 (+) Transcript_57801:502-1191(+)
MNMRRSLDCLNTFSASGSMANMRFHTFIPISRSSLFSRAPTKFATDFSYLSGNSKLRFNCTSTLSQSHIHACSSFVFHVAGSNARMDASMHTLNSTVLKLPLTSLAMRIARMSVCSRSSPNLHISVTKLPKPLSTIVMYSRFAPVIPALSLTISSKVSGTSNFLLSLCVLPLLPVSTRVATSTLFENFLVHRLKRPLPDFPFPEEAVDFAEVGRLFSCSGSNSFFPTCS